MANGLKKQKQKWKALAKHKSSLVLYLITILSAAITVFVLGYLIVYILANGIPHLKPSLFAFTYTSDNVSMMPALINTVLMTLATLIVAVPLGIFAAIYLVEYAKKGNKFVGVVRVTAETLDVLAEYCAEFLIHAADVEGLCTGIDRELVEMLGNWRRLPMTYAGGISRIQDIDEIDALSGGTMDATVGSALDLFGGGLIRYGDLVARQHGKSGMETV